MKITNLQGGPSPTPIARTAPLDLAVADNTVHQLKPTPRVQLKCPTK